MTNRSDDEERPAAGTTSVAAASAARGPPPRDRRFAGLGGGAACPAWAFGREFRDGVSLAVAPGGEPSLGLLLGVFGAAFCLTLDRALQTASPSLPRVIAAPLEAFVEKHHGAHLFTPPRFQDPLATTDADLGRAKPEDSGVSLVEEILTACGVNPTLHSAPPARATGRPSTSTGAGDTGGSRSNVGAGATAAAASDDADDEDAAAAARDDAARAASAPAEGGDAAGTAAVEQDHERAASGGGQGSVAAPPISEPDQRVMQELPLADAGFEFNFPLPPLLRADRQVQVHVIFDYSAYKPQFEASGEWRKLLDYCAEHAIPLPAFDHNTFASRPCTVFRGDPAKREPTLIIFHLKTLPGKPGVAGRWCQVWGRG